MRGMSTLSTPPGSLEMPVFMLSFFVNQHSRVSGCVPGPGEHPTGP